MASAGLLLTEWLLERRKRAKRALTILVAFYLLSFATLYGKVGQSLGITS